MEQDSECRNKVCLFKTYEHVDCCAKTRNIFPWFAFVFLSIPHQITFFYTKTTVTLSFHTDFWVLNFISCEEVKCHSCYLVEYNQVSWKIIEKNYQWVAKSILEVPTRYHFWSSFKHFDTHVTDDFCILNCS